MHLTSLNFFRHKATKKLTSAHDTFFFYKNTVQNCSAVKESTFQFIEPKFDT